MGDGRTTSAGHEASPAETNTNTDAQTSQRDSSKPRKLQPDGAADIMTVALWENGGKFKKNLIENNDSDLS